MNMLKQISLALLCPAALAIFGCSENSVPEPIQPRQDVYRPDDRAQIYYDSAELHSETAAGTPTVVRDSNGLLHVTVPIRSVVSKQLYVDYRVIFFDRDHREIDRSPWHDKFLTPNLPDSVTITSTSARAESFQMQFRYSNALQNAQPQQQSNPAY
jgi:hypothetical protein